MNVGKMSFFCSYIGVRFVFVLKFTWFFVNVRLAEVRYEFEKISITNR